MQTNKEKQKMKTIKTAAIVIFMAGLTATAGTRTVFELSRSSIDGGGGMRSVGRSFELSGTIAQTDAGTLRGGPFSLSGGFWFEVPLGDCEDDGDVELYDYQQFERCLTGPSRPVDIDCQCFDVNRSGAVDLIDFHIIQSTYTGP